MRILLARNDVSGPFFLTTHPGANETLDGPNLAPVGAKPWRPGTDRIDLRRKPVRHRAVLGDPEDC